MSVIILKNMKGIREMAQSFRTLAAVPENMGTIPSTTSWLTLILGALSLSFDSEATAHLLLHFLFCIILK